MPLGDVGQLLPADEMTRHQIADTFAVVRESDRQWTREALDRDG